MTKDSSLYVCEVNLFDFKKKYLLEKNPSQINYLWYGAAFIIQYAELCGPGNMEERIQR